MDAAKQRLDSLFPVDSDPLKQFQPPQDGRTAQDNAEARDKKRKRDHDLAMARGNTPFRTVFTPEQRSWAVTRANSGWAVPKVAATMGVSVETVRNWVQAHEAQLLHGRPVPASMDGRVFSGRPKVVPRSFTSQAALYVRQRRAELLPVTSHIVAQKMTFLAAAMTHTPGQDRAFSASRNFMSKFLRAVVLSPRNKPNRVKVGRDGLVTVNRDLRLEPRAAALTFMATCARLRHLLGLPSSAVINVDETHSYYEIQPRGVLEDTGRRRCEVRSYSHEGDGFTVLNGYCGDGRRLPLLFVFRHKAKLKAPIDPTVEGSVRSAWSGCGCVFACGADTLPPGPGAGHGQART